MPGRRLQTGTGGSVPRAVQMYFQSMQAEGRAAYALD